MSHSVESLRAHAEEQKKQFRSGMTCEEIGMVIREQLAFWRAAWNDLHPPTAFPAQSRAPLFEVAPEDLTYLK